MAFYCRECKEYVGDGGHFDLEGIEEEAHMAFQHGFVRNYRSRASVDGGTIFQGSLPGQPTFTKVVEDQTETPPTIASPGPLQGKKEWQR